MKTLSEENEWRGFFENLPVGTTTWTYSYEVREQAVKDYTASYSQVSREWTIMNKYTKGTTNAGNKPAVRGLGSSKAASGVKTGDNTNILLWALLLVAAGGDSLVSCGGEKSEKDKQLYLYDVIHVKKDDSIEFRL